MMGGRMFCSGCGAALEPGAGACGSCGKLVSTGGAPPAQPLATVPAPPPPASTPPLPPSTFCKGCGTGLVVTAVTCPQCGTPTRSDQPKDKTVAVLLAVFLGFWTWVYTYKRDAWKFWLNLGLGVITFGLWTLFVSYPWAIIDAAVRPASYYQNFPNG